MPGTVPPPLPASPPPLGVNPPTASPPSGVLARLRVRAAVMRSRGRVVAGPGVAAGRGVRWDVSRDARLVLGEGCAIGRGTRFHVGAGGDVSVGPQTVFGDRCVVRVLYGARLGAACRLADEAVLLDTAPVVADVDVPVRRQGETAAPIVIGDGVRVGSRAVVHGGVRIGDGAQVGAWLVVAEDIAAGVVLDGTVPPSPVPVCTPDTAPR